MRRYLEAGKIINTHGVKGDVKIDVWCDSPETLASLSALYMANADGSFTACRVERASVHKKMALVHFAGVDGMEAALALKNKTVYAAREDIPVDEGSHFIADLIGLDLIDDETDALLGKIKNVITGGVHDIYEAELCGGGVGYMPAVDEFVIEIDLQKGIRVRVIEGMLE